MAEQVGAISLERMTQARARLARAYQRRQGAPVPGLTRAQHAELMLARRVCTLDHPYAEHVGKGLCLELLGARSEAIVLPSGGTRAIRVSLHCTRHGDICWDDSEPLRDK